MSAKAKKVFLVSAPLFGHAIPLLQLGLKLSAFHHVTLAVSDSLLTGIRNEIKDPDCPVHLFGIKENESPENEMKRTEDLVRRLLQRMLPSTRDFFLNLSSHSITDKTSPDEDGLTVDIVIADSFLAGPASVVHQRGIPFYLFNTARVTLTQVFLTLDIDEPDNLSPSLKHSPHTRRSIGLKILDPNLERNKDILMDSCTKIPLAEGIIFNSLREADEKDLLEMSILPAMKNMKTFFVGPLISEPSKEGTYKDPKEKSIEKWLDGHATASVLYVSFGSLAVPDGEQVTEIGKALLFLKVPFIWSLPASHHVHLPEEIRQAMSSDTGHGEKPPFFVLPWVPQKLVLAHPSISVFLSHCGWNSTLETLANGVPIIAWPMFADQLMNADWLEEEGIAQVVRGTGQVLGRLVAAEEIADIFQQVANWKCDSSATAPNLQKSSYKAAAEKWQTKIRVALADGGSSREELLKLARF